MKDIEDFYGEMNGALDLAIERINRRPGIDPAIIINREAIRKNLKESYNHIRSAKYYHDKDEYRMAAVEVVELKQLLTATKNLKESYPLDIDFLPDRIINSQIVSLSLILNNWLFDD